MKSRVLLACALGAALTATWAITQVSRAQQPMAPKVTPLMKAPFAADPNKESVMIRVEWPANASTPWHTHPGDEYATVLEGSLITQREGEEPKTVTAGQAYHQPAGVVHIAKTGDQTATTINVFVIEKGQPLSKPVQK